MKEFTIEVRDGVVKGECLMMKLLRSLNGRFRCELYSLNKRSSQQNKYLHVVFTLCVRGLRDGGYSEIYDMEDAKLFYKRLYLKVTKVNEQTGELYPVLRKTSQLSKDELSIFIDRIRDNQLQFFGNYIPSSEEYNQHYSKWDLAGLAAA